MACCIGDSKSEESPANYKNEHALEPLNPKSNEKTVVEISKYGKPKQFDPNFKGPTKNRSCTDIPCLILFILAIAIQVLVVIFAIKNGNPGILIRPTDSMGNVCGYGNLKKRPNLLYFDMLKCAHSPDELIIRACHTPQVCVTKCPNSTFFWFSLYEYEQINRKRDIERRKKELICVDGFDPATSEMSIQDIIKHEYCAPYYFDSHNFYGRCIPKILRDAAKDILKGKAELKKLMDSQNIPINISEIAEAAEHMMTDFFKKESGFVSNLLSDIAVCWPHILFGVAIGAFLSLLWCILIHLFACVFVYLTLLLFFIAFFSGSFYSFYRYKIMAPNELDWSGGNLVFSKNPSYYLNFRQTWFIFGIIFAVLTTIVLLVLLCLGRQIALAITLLKEATKTISSNLATLFFPILPWLLQILTFVIWAGTAVYLASSGRPTFQYKLRHNKSLVQVNNVSDCRYVKPFHISASCFFLNYSGNDWALYLQLYNVFMAFWVGCFVVSLGELILAGVFASWYWTFNKNKDLPSFPLLQSIWRTLRYHIGSAAFGSLLIALTKFFRLCLELLERQMKASENMVSKAGFCILRCCFWCLEKCLRFLNKNAYIVIAIHGNSFCFAARDALFLIMRNILRMAILNSVTGFILFVGKLLVAGITATLTFLFFDDMIPYVHPYVPQIHHVFIPVLLVFLGTWGVASLFFDVFDFAVDTLFICCMEDLERNDGTPDKPYFMSKSLLETLGKKNTREVESARSDGCCSCCC